MIGLLAGLAAVLAIDVESLPQPPESNAPVEFEDPKQRGAPFETERPRISKAYRGVWADSLANCHASNDRGMQIEIGRYAIGAQPVKRVWAYSDYPAMIVETIGQGVRRETIYLDLSLDEGHISVGESGYGDRIMVKCPPLPVPEAATGPSSWPAQAASACKYKDFDAFFEAFVESLPVQWKYRAQKIRMVGSNYVKVIRGAEYGLLPFSSDGAGYFYLRTKPYGTVMADISELAGDDYRVEWSQAEFEENGDVKRQYGTHGWLLFKRRGGCWQMVEDGVGRDDAK